jgi:hypothetical protein
VSIPNFDTYGATSLYTTVGDLIKWEGNLDAPSVADRAIIGRMEAPTILTNGDTSTYGFGLVTGRYRGARFVEHNGADAGYRSYVGRFPQTGLSIAVLCNAATANTTALARGVADAFLGASLTPVEVAVAPQAVPVSAELVQKRAGTYVQPTTLQVVELTAQGGKLRFGRGDREVLVPLAENRFRLGDAPVDIVFRDGDHAGFERRPLGGGRPVVYEWKAPIAPTRALMAQYTGRYVSDELGGSIYTVTPTDSTITLRTAAEPADTARLVFADTFLALGSTVQFTRTKGVVTGFEVTDSRTRHVKFAKR